MNTQYSKWLDSITLPTMREEEHQVLPDELEIQSLWYQGLFGLEFETTEGKQVIIQYLGEWNHGAGPDFKECLITIDGEEKKGAIEIDLTPVHWELHGHAVNSDFDNVILHVSFAPQHATSFCRTSENKNVPQVFVPTERISAVIGNRTDMVADTIPGYCAEQFKQWSESEINTLLSAAARHRLGLKACHLSSQLKGVGLKETLWQAVATTLGYKPNQQALRLLSQRVSARKLRSFPHDRQHVALVLGVSGFLSPELYLLAPKETQQYLKSLWKDWWKLRINNELKEERAIPWKIGAQRPVNHPHRRVATLALLLPILPQIIRVMKSPSSQAISELKEKLLSIEDHFWSHHYTLTSAPSKSKLKLFGEEKFNELLVNFLIPLWYLKAPNEAYTFYSKIKTSAKNTQVKSALGRLFFDHNSSHKIAKLKYQHQGLQQLYQDFCLKSGCLKCEFPKLQTYKEEHQRTENTL